MVLWLVMLGIGFWGLFDRFLTVGEFVATVYILQRLSAGSFTFIQMGQQIFKALGTIRDAMPVMTTPPTITDRPGAKQLIVRHGEIRFENVQFAYKSDKGVIDDLSLTVRAGEKVGLVGLSGAGKTTVVNLLLRFYDIHGGAIHIDGQDIRAVSQASLRQNIGVIAQDVALLHRSVGDNIRYGRPEATSAEIEQAAQAAQADSFIADLTDGEGRKAYEAFVGDRGVKLSGGQRQRVSIARVLLKNAPILILDEATSALDSEAEAAIQEKLNLLMEGKTSDCHRTSSFHHHPGWIGSLFSIVAGSSRKAHRMRLSNRTGSMPVCGSGRRVASFLGTFEAAFRGLWFDSPQGAQLASIRLLGD